MVFKLFHSYAASYHDIWIFVGYIKALQFLKSPSVGFIRRHLTREFSFAPSYCFSLSTRSQSRFQNVDFLFCRCFFIMLYLPFLCELFLPNSVPHRRRGSAHLKTVVPCLQISSPNQSPFCIIIWRGISFVLSPCLFFDLLSRSIFDFVCVCVLFWYSVGVFSGSNRKAVNNRKLTAHIPRRPYRDQCSTLTFLDTRQWASE